MLNQFKVLSTETLDRQGKAADAQAEVRLKATEQLMVPVRESLDRFSSRLTEVEKERVAMSAELRVQVAHVQQTGETLRRETAALVTALRKPQIRGSWGETQLKRVAEIAGMVDRCDFELQHTTRDDDRLLRPDMRVNLAEGKHLFVDAKVPLTAFLEAAETEDESVRAEALTRYARHVRTHVDQLSSKQYWKAAETPEFVVLFLPSEMFFAAALDQIPDLYDYAAARDVVLATPTTLIGLLRAVAYGWKQAALAESAAEVFRLGRDLHEKLGLMGNRLTSSAGRCAPRSTPTTRPIATVEGTVLVRARRFRDLKVSDKELTALPQIDDAGTPDPGARAGRRRRAGRADGRPGQQAAPDGTGPEADELVRADPDLLELVEADMLPRRADRRSAPEAAPPTAGPVRSVVDRAPAQVPAQLGRQGEHQGLLGQPLLPGRRETPLDQEVEHALDQVLGHRGAAGHPDRARPRPARPGRSRRRCPPGTRPAPRPPAPPRPAVPSSRSWPSRPRSPGRCAAAICLTASCRFWVA